MGIRKMPAPLSCRNRLSFFLLQLSEDFELIRLYSRLSPATMHDCIVYNQEKCPQNSFPLCMAFRTANIKKQIIQQLPQNTISLLINERIFSVAALFPKFIHFTFQAQNSYIKHKMPCVRAHVSPILFRCYL